MGTYLTQCDMVFTDRPFPASTAQPLVISPSMSGRDTGDTGSLTGNNGFFLTITTKAFFKSPFAEPPLISGGSLLTFCAGFYQTLGSPQFGFIKRSPTDIATFF